MNVLVLTDILPAPILTKKRQENDVLITTATFHENLHPDVKYIFVFVVTYSNFFLSLISNKWKEFKQFKGLGKYNYQGREIEIIAVPNFKEDGPFKAMFINIGYYINRKKLKQLITASSIDLVHAHQIKTDAGIAYNLYKDLGIPYVVTSRKLGKLTLGKTLKEYLSSAKAIINLGYEQKAIADQHNKHSYLVPHGIDQHFLARERKYDPVKQPLRIVSLCRLLKWKNIDKVLLALENVQHDFTYDIYGDGPDLERLQSLLSESTISAKVNFKGYIPYHDVPGTLMKYDLFVLPSYREMFGRVYIEAMACGLPVIGAKNCGIDGYIENGVQGFLVNHLDIQEITHTINRFMEDDALKITMGKNAKNLSNDFSWVQVIDKVDSIYRQSLKT